MKRFLLITSMALLFSACGKKGQLIAPEALVPSPAQNFSVLQKGADFRLTWLAPTREQGGRPLRDLAGFNLLRRDIAADGNNCATCLDSWKLLTKVDLDLPGETKKSGPTFIYFDRGLPPGSTSQYQLLALSRSGGSSAPAASPLKKLLPPAQAPAITAEPLPASIRVSFNYTIPAGGKLLGFNIYRRQTTAEPVLLPLNEAPITQTTWEDQQLQFGQSYRYTATALLETSGETVESLPSAEIELLFSIQDIR